jgi:hypothetical protein
MVQELVAAIVPPQVVVFEKSPELVPVKAMDAMLSVALPEFVKVAVCPVLVVPTT